MPDQPTVEQPLHPMSQMTTGELGRYQKELASAIAFFDKKSPVPPARERLRQRLDEVLVEQESRESIRRGGSAT